MNVAEILETMEYGPAPESAAPVEAWLNKHNRSFDLFIGGEWTPAEAHLDSFNPATGKKLAAVAHASQADVDAAVKAARAAQPGWAKIGSMPSPG
jgi:aldehyde dehydrogenase (NAD+)